MIQRLFFFAILLSICTSSLAQFISPRNDTVCGGQTVTYTLSASGHVGTWQHYEWNVEGGVFANGLTQYIQPNKSDPTATVTWNTTPRQYEATLQGVEVYSGNDYADDIELVLFSVAQPDPIQGDLLVLTGSETTDLSTDTDYPWHVDAYAWYFYPEGGTARRIQDNSNSVTVALTGTEYGTISVKTYNNHCELASPARTATITRQLPTPTWNTKDLVMCNNTTSTFSINSVTHADTYLWEATGGFTIYNGSSYVSSYETSSTSVTVKSRSSNGGGSISVTAKPPSSDTHTLDSETLELDVWSGVFGNTYVTGTAPVCHNSLYVYTAVPPVGSPSSYTYTWPTKPSGWYTMSTWTNNIQVATPTLASNMTYGPIRAKIRNECGWSTEGGITTYPGWGCGGYYMAAPNPAGEYTEIDIASEDAKTLEAEYKSEITLTVVDKMGTPMMKEVVYSLPYQLNTSRLPKGEYVIHIIDQAKGRETRVDAMKILVNR